MIRERLFGQLGKTAYDALIDATALGRSRRHALIDLDHWALSLLRHDRSDIALLLDELGCNISLIQRRLEDALGRIKESGDSLRDISSVLEHSVGPAVAWSRIVAPASRARSGHLLLSWLENEATRRWLHQLDSAVLASKPLEVIIECYESLAQSWPESSESSQPERLAPLAVAGAGATGNALAQWGHCLSDQAEAGELDPVVGRNEELRTVLDILLRRRQNNPILIGEAGVGKTAIAEALAQRIQAGQVPEALKQAKVWVLDVARLQAGAGAKGEFEQRLRMVLDEVISSANPIILFCDEAHTLVGAGGTAGTGDAANLIKPMLARGQLRMLAATTWSEYKQFIEPDAALTRRFQAVSVDEPDDEKAIAMMRTIAPKFARHHGVHISDSALIAAVRLSRRHLPARQLPDKAVSLLDTACARVAMSQTVEPAELERLREGMANIDSALHWRLNDHRIGIDVPAADQLELQRNLLGEGVLDLEQSIKLQREQVAGWLTKFASEEDQMPPSTELRPFLQETARWIHPWVDAKIVSEVLSEWTGIPNSHLADSDAQRAIALESELQSKIHGQQGALHAITQTLQVSLADLNEHHRPLGVLMLAGPTGTGKSQTAVALAELLFGGADHLIQFNMNEFQEAHTVSTLKGAPPGYVGFGKGGRLTEAVRKRPYSVLLLDEFDRAHADVHEIFYQAFDQGWMEDGEGRRISFRNCLILLTSNLGETEIENACRENPEITQGRLEALTRERMQSRFSSALLARMQIVAFRPLDIVALTRIADRALVELGGRLEAAGLLLEFDTAVPGWMAHAVARHPASGRAIRDLLRRSVVPVVAQAVLSAKAEGSRISTVRLSAEEQLSVSFDQEMSLPDAAAPSAKNTAVSVH